MATNNMNKDGGKRPTKKVLVPKMHKVLVKKETFTKNQNFKKKTP
jgi:hypothetical protein